MTSRLPSDLLERTAEESARVLALRYLDEIDGAQRRLSDPQDREALHDFRVGLRRLRSCLRAYRRQFKGSVTRKIREKLRDLMQSTNSGRDAEVQLAWLRKQGEGLGAQDIPGFFWLMGSLEARKGQLLQQDTAALVRRYSRYAALLRERLGILRIRIGDSSASAPRSFRQVSGELISEHVAQLQVELEQVRDVNNVQEIHRARIAVKRLRYLLEPVGRSDRRARALISRLKVAQDLLGEHHDMQVMLGAIASERAGLSRSDPDMVATLSPGIEKVEQLAREQAAVVFEQFNSRVRGELVSGVLGRADTIARSLREAAVSTAYHRAPLKPQAPGNGNGVHGAVSAVAPSVHADDN
jgi:CHAD domain-containing protein